MILVKVKKENKRTPMKLKQGARAAVTAAVQAVQAVKNQSCSHHQKHQPKVHFFLCGEYIFPHSLLMFFQFDHNISHLSLSFPLSGLSLSLSLSLSCSLTHSLNIVMSSKSRTTPSNQQRKKRRKTEPLSTPPQ